MDHLIQAAQRLADQNKKKIPVPVEKRIAYVVSHGKSYASNGYVTRTHDTAKALKDQGFEVLCFVRPGCPWDVGIAKEKIEIQKIVDGIRYIHTNWRGESPPKSEYEHLIQSVACFEELFRAFRPQIILAASEYKVGLPAWVSAQRLGLLFYNDIREELGSSQSAEESDTHNTSDVGVRLERDAFVSKQAQKVFVEDQSMKEELGRRGVDLNRVSVAIAEKNRLSNNNSVVDGLLRFSNDGLILTKPILDRRENKLSQKPLWFEFSIDEVVPHSVYGRLVLEDETDNTKPACLARIQYLDTGGKPLAPPYSDLPISETIGPFSYLNVDREEILQLIPPFGARTLRLGIQTWSAKHNIFIKGPVRCKNLLAVSTKAGPTPKCLPRVASLSNCARLLKEIKIAAILDEFTMECFRHEVQLTTLTPNDWESELETSQPDMLFVESCWFGNDNQWGGLIYNYTSNGPNKMSELIKVIAYCRSMGVPTVFWAKEDPVHYKRFAPTAKLFDYVYTSDVNMVQAYKNDFGIDAEALSFFCQPRVHNPVPVIKRNNKAAFAGSYYSDKIERCEDFHSILKGLDQAGINYDIYDRCLERGVEHLQYPEYLQKCIVGYLEPSEMWKAYKGYRYTINLNTVKHSPTMFARRVYESLASGTPVISNYSEGVVTQFGGIVCASDRQKDMVDFLFRLQDPFEYQVISERGVRETLGRHTLADRLEQVCERLSIRVKTHLPIVNAIYTASTEAEVEQARSNFKKQGYHRKRLVVTLQNSSILYPYLNKNTNEEVFRVLTQFAKAPEGLEVNMELEGAYPETYLEDQAIETQYKNIQSQ